MRMAIKVLVGLFLCYEPSWALQLLENGTGTRKMHGATPYVIPVGDVECRNSGITEIQLAFDAQVWDAVGGSLTADDFTLSAGSVASVTSGWGGANYYVILTLSSPSNFDTTTLTATLEDGYGIAHSIRICFSALVGDVDSDGGVDQADGTLIEQYDGAQLSSTTFRYDLDADGQIEGENGIGDDWLLWDAASPSGSVSLCSTTDCNTNGVADLVELAFSPKRDCNGNNVPDMCDIAANSALDLDSNGILDTCQPDCNTNGYPDSRDISSGTSGDCNANGMPDECEFLDCNNNALNDLCEVVAGTAADNNENNIPDECECAFTLTLDGNTWIDLGFYDEEGGDCTYAAAKDFFDEPFNSLLGAMASAAAEEASSAFRAEIVAAFEVDPDLAGSYDTRGIWVLEEVDNYSLGLTYVGFAPVGVCDENHIGVGEDWDPSGSIVVDACSEGPGLDLDLTVDMVAAFGLADPPYVVDSLADTNNNGVVDTVDIYSEVLADYNEDGIPDAAQQQALVVCANENYTGYASGTCLHSMCRDCTGSFESLMVSVAVSSRAIQKGWFNPIADCPDDGIYYVGSVADYEERMSACFVSCMNAGYVTVSNGTVQAMLAPYWISAESAAAASDDEGTPISFLEWWTEIGNRAH